MPKGFLIGLILLLSVLSGCAPVVIGGAAAVGASAIYDRRPAEVVLDDQKIELMGMSALMQDSKVQGHSSIAVTSYNRTVLLTGQAESKSVIHSAIDHISHLARVQRVIDEITVGSNLDLMRKSEDVYITSRAKLAMLQIALPDFNPTRVKVVTEDGVIYLLGLVSQEEGDAAAEQIRYVPGVKRVIKLFEEAH